MTELRPQQNHIDVITSSAGVSSARSVGKFTLYNSRIFHILVIIGAIVVIYSGTFDSPFLFDDLDNIVDSPAIKDFGYFMDPAKTEGISTAFNKPLFRTRYIGYLTFALNYALGGLDVRGYHLVNILIHICNSLLVYWFLSLLGRSPYFLPEKDTISFSPTSRYFLILFSALLFAVHPLQTQAVTYIVQRFASLATLFYLLSIASYLKFRLHASPMGLLEKTDLRKICLYATSFLSAILAMKTKEFSVSLPAMLALLEIMFLDGTVRKKVLYLLPFVLSTLLLPLSLFGFWQGAASDVGLDEMAAYMSGANDAISGSDYLLTQFRVIVTYIRLLIFPVAQNVDYDYPIYTSFFSFAVIASFLLLMVILALGAYLYKRSGAPDTKHRSRKRLISFGIFWFFIALAPESSIVPIKDVIFEHRVYLPSVGFFIVLTASIDWLAYRWDKGVPGFKKMLWYVMFLLAFGLSSATYARNTVWSDDISLWEDAAKKSPDKDRPHSNLGLAYEKKGLTDMAIYESQEALRINPNSREAHTNLGIAYKKKGLTDMAISEYLDALRINPEYAKAHNNLGNIYMEQGELDRAVGEFLAAIKINPYIAEIYYNLGNAYEKQGRLDDAIHEYLAAVRINPAFAEAHYNLSYTYTKLGRASEALGALEDYARIKQQDLNARENLENLYKMNKIKR